VPALLDRYLARTGVKSQLTGDKAPTGISNLWEPADEDKDYGAHGGFDRRSRGRSLQLWISQHRRLVSLAGLGLAAVAGFGLRRR
jgi:hypothetical protein